MTISIDSRRLQYTVNLKQTIGCNFLVMTDFDLGPLLQGQTMATQHESAYTSLIVGSRGLQCTPNLFWETKYLDGVRFDLKHGPYLTHY